MTKVGSLNGKVILKAELVYKDKDGNVLKTVTLQSNPEKRHGTHDQQPSEDRRA